MTFSLNRSCSLRTTGFYQKTLVVFVHYLIHQLPSFDNNCDRQQLKRQDLDAKRLGALLTKPLAVDNGSSTIKDSVLFESQQMPKAYLQPKKR